MKQTEDFQEQSPTQQKYQYQILEIAQIEQSFDKLGQMNLEFQDNKDKYLKKPKRSSISYDHDIEELKEKVKEALDEQLVLKKQKEYENLIVDARSGIIPDITFQQIMTKLNKELIESLHNEKLVLKKVEQTKLDLSLWAQKASKQEQEEQNINLILKQIKFQQEKLNKVIEIQKLREIANEQRIQNLSLILRDTRHQLGEEDKQKLAILQNSQNNKQ